MATIRRVPMVWFRVTGRYRTVGHRKYKTWPLRTFQRAFYALAQGRDCTGYPNTNSIPMLVVDRLLLRDWPTDIGICATVNQRVAAPLKHQYQKEYSISKVAANYWDYTHDWNLAFSKRMGGISYLLQLRNAGGSLTSLELPILFRKG